MTDDDVATVGQGKSERDIRLLWEWVVRAKANRQKFQAGVSPTRAVGGVGAGETRKFGKGSAGPVCRESGIGGKAVQDVHKWLESNTTPEAIVVMLVCTGMIWRLTCKSELMKGPKGRTCKKGTHKWQNATTGPWFRYWRFPALQVVGQGDYAVKGGKAEQVWELVVAFKNGHMCPGHDPAKHPPGWSDAGAPFNLLEVDKRPAEDWGAEKTKMQEAGTWPVRRVAGQDEEEEEEGSGEGHDDDEEGTSTNDEEVVRRGGHTLCLFSCDIMRLPCPFLPLFSTCVCVR